MTISTATIRYELLAHLGNREWRMDNLYMIEDKQGNVIPFVRNESQRRFWKFMWWANTILKDRQRGFSTLISIFILDTCLFAPHTAAGIIDLTLPDAKKKLGKIIFAYHNLRVPSVRDQVRMIREAHESVEWDNGSRVDVSTSHRGGTLQILHVSEYGKIAARKPDVAKEIKTGAFNTIAAGCFQFVESTAEGQEGEFFEMCAEGQRTLAEGLELTHLDFRFHFFGWWMGEENELPEGTVAITDETNTYCDKIESELGITLNIRKRGWYQKKSKQQGDEMTREYPSTPKEAFEASIDGSYYAKAMQKIRTEGRITDVPYDEGFPVETFWDLGMDDSMTIWFRQRIGATNRIIDYYEASGEGLPHYARILKEKGYLYGKHYMPHDAAVRELGTGIKRSEKAEELGIKPVETVTRPRDTEAILDGIEAVRTFLSTCWFDRRKCSAGLKCLDNYRKEWDERLGTFRRGPLHNWASHGADSMRTGAVALKNETNLIPTAERKTSWRDRLSGQGSINGGMRPRGAGVA